MLSGEVKNTYFCFVSSYKFYSLAFFLNIFPTIRMALGMVFGKVRFQIELHQLVSRWFFFLFFFFHAKIDNKIIKDKKGMLEFRNVRVNIRREFFKETNAIYIIVRAEDDELILLMRAMNICVKRATYNERKKKIAVVIALNGKRDKTEKESERKCWNKNEMMIESKKKEGEREKNMRSEKEMQKFHFRF